MTEAEWNSETRPTALLYTLLLMHGRAFFSTWFGLKTRALSMRKLRLYACGCARQVWSGLPEEAHRVVELCEQHADGLATADEVEQARKGLDAVNSLADHGANVAVASAPWFPFQFGVGGWPVDLAARKARTLKGCIDDVDSDQCDLLRDLFTPFTQPKSEPVWVTWRGGLIPQMATTIYAEQRFGELPILADALEEAGCMEEAYLTHCRSGKEHRRGCWVVDTLLGKE